MLDDTGFLVEVERAYFFGLELLSPDEDEPTKIIIKPEYFTSDCYNYQDEAYFELFSKFGLSNLEA